MPLEDYLNYFQKLKVNKKGNHESPHKPCLLLAVIGLAEAGLFEDNKIRFSHALLDRYQEIFSLIKTQGDCANPYLPFFHLRTEKFWHLKPVKGRELVLEAIASASSFASIEENIDYAYVDEELFAHLTSAKSRNALRDILITRWFGSFSSQVYDLVNQDKYESNLRHYVETGIKEEQAQYEKPVRDTAFRRIVTEAYDYRCAATGLRIVLPGEVIMVQAAHLIPYADSRDDDPRNGMALTPDLHWALDRNIVSPGPDMKWHVSSLVDQRIADNRPLLDLADKDILLPKDKRFWPRTDALESRMLALK